MNVCIPAKAPGAPLAAEYRIISGCSRLDVPTASWAGRIPLKWREHRPHRQWRGNQATLIDEWPLHRVGPSGDTDSYDEQQTIGMLYEQADSPDLRLRAQDLDGLDAEIIFTDPYGPSFLGMVESQDSTEMMCAHPIFTGFWRGVRDDEAYKAWVRAYNEFLAEDYCPSCPRRLIGIGVLPDTGVDDALGEMENCALFSIHYSKLPFVRGGPPSLCCQDLGRTSRSCQYNLLPLGCSTVFRSSGSILPSGNRGGLPNPSRMSTKPMNGRAIGPDVQTSMSPWCNRRAST